MCCDAQRKRNTNMQELCTLPNTLLLLVSDEETFNIGDSTSSNPVTLHEVVGTGESSRSGTLDDEESKTARKPDTA